MFRFYAALLGRSARGVLDALGSFGTILGVLVIVLLNREWANAISDWGGVSPWWALVPMIVLAVYVIARANYREFVEVDAERSGSRRRSRRCVRRRSWWSFSRSRTRCFGRNSTCHRRSTRCSRAGRLSTVSGSDLVGGGTASCGDHDPLPLTDTSGRKRRSIVASSPASSARARSSTRASSSSLAANASTAARYRASRAAGDPIA